MKTQYIKDYKFVMDNYLMNNLNIIMNEAIPNKWDALFIVFGKEGAGKSTLATQIALFLDHDFNLDKTQFNPETFGETLDNAPEESSILWDEAITGAAAAKHADKVCQEIIARLTMIRKKRLKIIICLPYLYMLNKYFVSRCIASFYVYAHGFTNRGHFFAYNQSQVEYLYSLMKDKYRMVPNKALSYAAKSFFGTFSPQFCLPEDAYDAKKDKATKLLTFKENKDRTQLIKLINKGREEKKFTLSWAAKVINKDQGNLSKMLSLCCM